MHIKISIILAAILALSGCMGPQQRVSKTSDAIIAQALTGRYDSSVMSKLITQYRSSDITAEKLETYSDRTLTRLYEALNDNTFHSPDNAALVKMQENVLEERVRRKKFFDHNIRDLIMIYLGTRSFDKAAALKNRFPEFKLPCVPEIIYSTVSVSGPWRVYDVSDGGKKAQVKALPLAGGPKIVMAMLTGCHVGERAMTEILADPEMGPAFRKYGIVVTGKFDSVGVSMWRDYFKFTEVYLTFGKDDFPGLLLISSPSFNFMRDGKVIAGITGWGDDSKAEFLKNLHEILAERANSGKETK